jgi:hypothetical protein
VEAREEVNSNFADGPRLTLRAVLALALITGLLGVALQTGSDNVDAGSPYADPPALFIQTS